MTAAAIPNIFPGSPQVAGENTTFSAGPSEVDSFEDFLAKSQMPKPAHAQGTGQEAEDAGPFEDLFKLLNLIWGGSGEMSLEGLNSDSGDATGSASGELAPDNGSHGSPSSLSGFVSELQLILSLFQKLAASFEGTEEPLIEEAGQATGAATVGAEIKSDLTAQATQPSNKAASGAAIAPGIDLVRSSLNEKAQAGETASSAPSFPGDTSKTVSTSPASLEKGTEKYGQTAADSFDTGKNTSPLTTETDAGSKISRSEVDLHLLTFSYSRERGMDITDLRYSGISGPQMTMIGKTGGKDGRPGDTLDNFSAGGSHTGPKIQMAKAELKNEDGSVMSLKKVHVSSAFLKDDAYQTAGHSPKEGMKGLPERDDVITIDFTDLPQKHSKGIDARDTSSGSSKTIDFTSQIGSITADTGNIEPPRGDLPPRPSLDEAVTSQIRDGISQALKMNKNRAVLHLNPPELGSVKVNITVSHNNHVQASFVADHPETRHILEANMQHLRESLAENGFSMANVNVDVGGGFGQWSGAQQETITPFGLPSMWLKNNGDAASDQEFAAPAASKVGPYGMHVIA